MDTASNRSTVEVIGLGLAGVSAIKNFSEVGFDVTGFDRNNYVGGIWMWTSDTRQTSVLRSTRANISKQVNCYTDFPFPEDVPNFPSAADTAKYIYDYASNFNLHGKCRLGVRVEHVARSSNDAWWEVTYDEPNIGIRTERFDYVLVTTGAFARPFVPNVEGKELFSGAILTAQAFKEPAEYRNKRVVVVGLGNTGAEIAVDLSDVAEKVYLSYRSGARIIQRAKQGKTPGDHKLNRNLQGMGGMIQSILPSLVARLAASTLERQMIKTNPYIDPTWRLTQAPPVSNTTPIANDHIIDKFGTGEVVPVHGLRRFLPPMFPGATSSDIELDDGTLLRSIDIVIFCTGYHSDFSICGAGTDPCAFSTPEWDNSRHSNGMRYPRLYQGILSTTYPDSLAFLGSYKGHSISAFCNADLSTQAIAQIWKGIYPLPPQSEIERWCDLNYEKSLEQIKAWHIPRIGLDTIKLERWLNEVAGNKVNEHLGWGATGWRFWWNENQLYRLLAYGVNSPSVYRLFEGRTGARKTWDGARDAIYRANAASGQTD